MGYLAPVDAVDVSNSNTPGVVDPTNPVPDAYYRVVAQLDSERQVPLHQDQRLQRQQRPRGDPATTSTARRALHGGQRRQRQQSAARTVSIIGAGAQILDPEIERRSRRRTRDTDAGRELQHHPARRSRPDKIGKDDNFRGMTIFDNVLYYTKGSGGNGVNTRLLRRHHGTGLPERRRPAGARRDPADLAARLQSAPCRRQG